MHHTMNKVLSEKIDELKLLCKAYSVRTMYAFGSVCTDTFNTSVMLV